MRPIRKKASMELSVNFLVVIILGVVMFGMGIGIFYKVMEGTTRFKDDIDSKVQQQLLESIIGSNDLVKVVPGVADIAPRKTTRFTYVFRNELGEAEDFYINVVRHLDPDYQPFDNIRWPDDHIMFRSEAIPLENKKGSANLILIKAPKNARPGTYVFNVVLCTSHAADGNLVITDTINCPVSRISSGNRYSKIEKIYLKVR